jgi:CRP-like cAMP-binding protein
VSTVIDRLASPASPPSLRLRGIPPDARTALLQAALGPMRVPREAAQAMVSLLTEHVFRAGEVLTDRNQAADRLWLLVSGQVALGLMERGRLAHQTRLVEPGGWIDATSAWLGGPYLEDACAQHEVLAWSFPIDAVRVCGTAHPVLLDALARVQAQRIRELTEGHLGLLLNDAQTRCANWLLRHLQLQPSGDGRSQALVTLRERKRAIASQLGVTPETFSRILRQFQDRQIIEVTGYTVRILDMEALRRTARVPGSTPADEPAGGM